MPYEPKNAAYALNSYTWKVLEANLGWTKYQGKIPIIPSAQQPEFMESGLPFIVYGSAMLPVDDLYGLNTMSVAYNIYATTSTEVNKIANVLYEVFKRQDDAAADVNQWLGVEGVSRSGGGRGVSFGTIRVTMVEHAEPSDEEGGYVSAIVLLTARYTTGRDNLITTGFTV